MAAIGLFERYGVELEYMIVDKAGLSVLPKADELLKAASGEYRGDFEDGPIGWSNELALHVIELKTAEPARSLEGLAELFQGQVGRMNAMLAPLGGRLMPTAMHPWMDPLREMRLWPHDNSPIYDAFDRIFSCKGHGWANLQSMHINLPFRGDEEFGRLHAAIRLVLPLLPGLAASSPLMELQHSGRLDNRLDVYKTNAARVPSVSGEVIPEPVFTEADYREHILGRIYRDLAPHDPQGILRDEWANARGAIARFHRNAIEIRVLDVQECPAADLAIARLAVAAVRGLVEERWSSLEKQKAWAVPELKRIYEACVGEAGEATVEDPAYLSMFGLQSARASAADLWRHLADTTLPGWSREEWGEPLRLILGRGCLARRILDGLDGDFSRENVARTYARLCDCLERGEPYLGDRS